MISYATNNRWSRAGLGMVLGCLLFVAPPRCEAQNLVPNHSFEEYNDCLEMNAAYTIDTGPLGWFSASGTGDYFLSCLPYGSFNGVPLSLWAFQYPQDGEAFVGVITYRQFQGQREYFMVELIEPLVVGQTYFGSFFANAAWGGYEQYPQAWIASSHVGMLFTMQPRHWQSGQAMPVPGNFAQVYHPWIIADTVGWTLVSGSFVADSAYRYVMIGNHFNNVNTDTIHLGQSIQMPGAITLIDNVCVSPNPDGCPLALRVPTVNLDAVALYPNPAYGEVALSGVPVGSRVVIHDTVGRLLCQEDGLLGAWRKDVRSWARGSYLLRLEGQGKSRSFKFVLIE